MLTRVQKTLQQPPALSLRQPVLAGVSGGADSLTLLDLLVRLGYPVHVAHFNHLLRPTASHDAEIVERIAAKMGLPFVLGTDSVPRYAEVHHLSIEESARILRYRFLFEQAEQCAAQAVAVAHNADDQVETLLMHLLRGTGLDGLTGMTPWALPNPWSKTLPLVRPLLNIWRAEIDDYCTVRALTPLTDDTNADTTYFRNRLRHELIPELETYVPGFRTRLFQTADLLTADRHLLDELTAQAWSTVAAEIGDRYIHLQSSIFNLQSLALRRRLIRKALSHLRPGARDVDFALIQRALNFAKNPTATRQVDLGLGLRISLEDNRLTIADWDAPLLTDHWPLITDCDSLPVPGELDLGRGWTLRAEIPADLTAAKREAQAYRDHYRAWVDLGDQHTSLNIRPRRPGDRFQPLGMAGKSMKISDFMINEKIPRRARAGWPLVCAGDNRIIWVPGYRLADCVRVTAASQQIVLLTLLKSCSNGEEEPEYSGN